MLGSTRKSPPASHHPFLDRLSVYYCWTTEAVFPCHAHLWLRLIGGCDFGRSKIVKKEEEEQVADVGVDGHMDNTG